LQVNINKKKKDKSDQMNQKELAKLTDKELLEVAKNYKPSPICNEK
jgi:hypothetical protein